MLLLLFDCCFAMIVVIACSVELPLVDATFLLPICLLLDGQHYPG